MISEKKILGMLRSYLDEDREKKQIDQTYLIKGIRKLVEEIILPRLDALELKVVELKMKDRLSFTLEEAAETIGVSYSTIYHWASEGKLQTSQIGGVNGRRLVLRDDLIDLLITNSPAPNAKDIGIPK